LFAAPVTSLRRRADGCVLLSSGTALPAYWTSVAAMFRASAATRPERVLAAEREGDGWQTVTWAGARAAADAVGQSLLDRKLGERPVMILSGNSIDHLLLVLGAHTAGVPVVQVSVAYSLQSRDHAKLREIVELADPGLVFAGDGDAFAAAVDAGGAAAEVVTSSGTVAGRSATAFSELTRASPTPELERRYAEQTPDTVIKILFTSGSTGRPKGVLNTNRMLCANQQMVRQVWPFLAHEPPVLLDWLPWSHTFGGNHNLNVEIKLVPVGDETEIRVKGPNVTPGYYWRPDLTAAAFDDEGFYRTGDAVRLLDASSPESGLRFDGRIAEDFKLSTGTWVSVGTLRVALLSAAEGLLQDAVLAGHDGDYAAALAWLNRGAGSSRQVVRLLLVEAPPSLDSGEITDKGYVNQRAVLHHRSALVDALYADPPPAEVICWPAGPARGARSDPARVDR